MIPTANRAVQLRATLSVLSALDYPRARYEIIVVNDGRDIATERTVAALQDAPVTITYVAQDKRGAGAARNHGAALSKAEFLFFCDDDIAVEPSHIHQHLQTHAAHDPSLVNGREEFAPATLAALQRTPFGRYRIMLKDKFRWPENDDLLGSPFSEPEALVACDLSLRAKTFWALGGFDERFPWGGAEDRDFGLRAHAAGYSLVRNDAIKVWHNDPVLTFRQFCERDERYARGIVTLARRYPREYTGAAFIDHNRPLATSDPPRLIVTKLAKSLLSRRLPLTALHAFVSLLERSKLSQARLEQAYSSVVGLYIFRGVRAEWRSRG